MASSAWRPDDHVKLLFPGEFGEAIRRDYTPRFYSPKTQQLTIDFALHDGGPATEWAMAAEVGDTLEIAGPRGSAIVPASFDWWLLIGDETALPAIGRRIEELAPGTLVTSLGLVTGAEEEKVFDTRATLTPLWVHRPARAADDANPALAVLDFPPGDGFIWIAAEARVACRLRDYVVEGHGHAIAWTKASGYWLKGEADADDTL
jgi:NADPH-dependent ferric siderophore reductase